MQKTIAEYSNGRGGLDIKKVAIDLTDGLQIDGVSGGDQPVGFLTTVRMLTGMKDAELVAALAETAGATPASLSATAEPRQLLVEAIAATLFFLAGAQLSWIREKIPDNWKDINELIIKAPQITAKLKADSTAGTTTTTSSQFDEVRAAWRERSES